MCVCVYCANIYAFSVLGVFTRLISFRSNNSINSKRPKAFRVLSKLAPASASSSSSFYANKYYHWKYAFFPFYIYLKKLFYRKKFFYFHNFLSFYSLGARSVMMVLCNIIQTMYNCSLIP